MTSAGTGAYHAGSGFAELVVEKHFGSRLERFRRDERDARAGTVGATATAAPVAPSMYQGPFRFTGFSTRRASHSTFSFSSLEPSDAVSSSRRAAENRRDASGAVRRDSGETPARRRSAVGDPPRAGVSAHSTSTATTLGSTPRGGWFASAATPHPAHFPASAARARGRGVRGAVQVPAGGGVDEVGGARVVVRRRRRGDHHRDAVRARRDGGHGRHVHAAVQGHERASRHARRREQTRPRPRDGGGAHCHRRRRRRDSATRRVRFRLRLGRAGDARRRLLRLEPPHVGRRELGARRDVVAGRGGGERGRGFAVELGARLRGERPGARTPPGPALA